MGMSRFSKLETGVPQQPDAETPAAKASGEQQQPLVQYDHEHYFRQAEEAFYSGDSKKALKLYSRAIQADHSQIGPWIGQVLCLLDLKQFGEAMVWAKRSLELFPEDPRLISLEGVVYANQGMVQRGLGASDYAMRLDSTECLVWLVRAQVLCLADNRNYQFCLDKAIEMTHPDDFKTPMLVGLFMIRQKKWSQAVEYLKQASLANPKNAYLWSRLGYAYEKLGMSQLAMDAYAAASDCGGQHRTEDASISRVATTPVFVRIFRRIFH